MNKNSNWIRAVAGMFFLAGAFYKKPEFWTTDFGFVSRYNQAVCGLYCQKVVCLTLGIKRHFEAKHEKSIMKDAENIEFLKKAVFRYDKQSSIFKKVIRNTNQTIEGSYKVPEVIAKHGRPFTDGIFAKEAFLSCAEVLFDDVPNKCIIVFRIKDIPVSPRTEERRITNMSTDVTEQQTVASKAANVFSVALDKSVDIKDNPPLAVLARYCINGEAHEKVCCLNPIYGTTKEKDILDTFTKNFEKREIDIKKIFSVTIDGTPAMMGQQRRLELTCF